MTVICRLAVSIFVVSICAQLLAVAARADLANPVPVNHNEPVTFDYSGDASRCNAANVPNLLSGWGPQWQYVQPSGVALDPNTGMPRTRILRGPVDAALTVSVKDDNGAVHFYDDISGLVFPDSGSAYLRSKFNSDGTGEPHEQGRIEVEWEKGSIPMWAWPFAHDFVQYEGKWIWDCGHQGPGGGYRSEIHSPREILSYRGACGLCLSGFTPRGGSTWVFGGPLGNTPLPATVVDAYISSNGGETPIYTDCPPQGLTTPIFLCSTFPDSLRSRVDGDLTAVPAVAGLAKAASKVPTWYQRVNDTDFEFDVYPPDLPAAFGGRARLAYAAVNRIAQTGNDARSNYPGFTGGAYHDDLTGRDYTNAAAGLAPIIQPFPAANPDHIHVIVPFTTVDSYENHLDDTTPPDPATWNKWLQAFGYTFAVTWDIVPSQPSREFDVNLSRMKIYDDMDTFGEGEWNMRVALNGHWFVDPDASDSEVHHEFSRSIDDGCFDSPCEDGNEYDLHFPWHVAVPLGQPMYLYYWVREIDVTFNDYPGDRLLTLGLPSYGTTSSGTWVSADNGASYTVTGDVGDDCPEIADASLASCYAVRYSVQETTPAFAGATVVVGTPSIVVSGTQYVAANTPITIQPSVAGTGWGRLWRGSTLAENWTSGWNPRVLTGIGDGSLVLQYHAQDASNAYSGTTLEQQLALDAGAPSTTATLAGTAGQGGWFRSSVTLSLAASDPALSDGTPGSDVSRIETSLDGGTTWQTYAAPLVFSTEGVASVLYRAVDHVGNTEATRTATVRIDKTLPQLALNGATDSTFSYTAAELLSGGGLITNATSLTVTYTASDALSGLYQVRLDGSSSSSGAGSLTIALPTGTSTHTLQAEDLAGNVASLTFATVSVPTLPGGPNPQDAGFWKNAVKNGVYSQTQFEVLLSQANVVSLAFGATLSRYADATAANYADYLNLAPSPTADEKVRRELLAAWLNLVSGREPTAQSVDVGSVRGWQTVVTNTGGSSATAALNVVREVERRLAGTPSAADLDTIKNVLEQLNGGRLNR